MKHLLMLPAALGLLLSGCSKAHDDYDLIRSACLAEGDDTRYCDCYADALERNVSDSVAKRIADGIRGGKTRIEAEDDLSSPDLKKIQTLFPVIWSCVSAG